MRTERATRLVPETPAASRRLRLFAQTLAASTLVCVGFSWRLWLARDHYPLAPAADFLPAFPRPWDAAALAAMSLPLFGLLLRPTATLFAGLSAAALGWMFLQDQNRLWPSFYQFFLMLVVLATWNAKDADKDAPRVLSVLRMMTAAVYFWAGVHKLNVHFFEREFPWFMEPLAAWLPIDASDLFYPAIGAALFEVLVGVLLFVPAWRRAGLIGATLIHALIFVCIGPLRDHWNNGSWLWGQCVIAQTWILFFRAPTDGPLLVRSAPTRRSVAASAALALVVIMPLFNGLNLWDSSLSFNVYSGNKDYGEIHMLPGARQLLPAPVARFAEERADRDVLDVFAWSLAEFQANPYQEQRVLKAIMARVCEHLPPRTACLFVMQKASWFEPKRLRAFDAEGNEIHDVDAYFQGRDPSR